VHPVELFGLEELKHCQVRRMNGALLLQATRVTEQPSAVSQTVCFGNAGKWIYEHQKQPAPVEKAAYQKMPKVARLLDAHHEFVPRKNSVMKCPKCKEVLLSIS
jgi:hypothetical protein